MITSTRNRIHWYVEIESREIDCTRDSEIDYGSGVFCTHFKDTAYIYLHNSKSLGQRNLLSYLLWYPNVEGNQVKRTFGSK